MKNIKSVYLVHSAIFIWLIFYSFLVFQDFSRIHEINFEFGNDYSFKSIFHTLTNHSSFRYYLFFVTPLIGVFLKNNIGWILITSYMYFLIAGCILQLFFEEFLDISLLFFIIFWISGLVALILILILNLKNSSIQYYRIIKQKLLGYNVISFVSGFVIAFALVYWNNRHHFYNLDLS